MYARCFGLRQQPFSIAPDPRYLFMSERHREALAHLLYGVRGGGGFVLLTGEIGAGKTTVCRCFARADPQALQRRLHLQPEQTVEELLRSVCDEFRVLHRAEGATVKDYVDALNEFLLQTHAVGQTNVLIIDEAQNLSAGVLEAAAPADQPGDQRAQAAADRADRPARAAHDAGAARAGAARAARHRALPPRGAEPARDGAVHPPPLSRWQASAGCCPSSARRCGVHQLSRGVPRRINLLCDRALLGAYAVNKPIVDVEIVEKAAREVFDGALPGDAAAQRRATSATVAAGGLRPGRAGLAVWAGLELRAPQRARCHWRRLPRAAAASAVALAVAQAASEAGSAAPAVQRSAVDCPAAARRREDGAGCRLAQARRTPGARLTARQAWLDEGEPCAADGAPAAAVLPAAASARWRWCASSIARCCSRSAAAPRAARCC